MRTNVYNRTKPVRASIFTPHNWGVFSLGSREAKATAGSFFDAIALKDYYNSLDAGAHVVRRLK